MKQVLLLFLALFISGKSSKLKTSASVSVCLPCKIVALQRANIKISANSTHGIPASDYVKGLAVINAKLQQ